MDEKLAELSIQIVSARASYRYNQDISTDPTMPLFRCAQALRAMRATGRQIVRLVNQRNKLFKESLLKSYTEQIKNEPTDFI